MSRPATIFTGLLVSGAILYQFRTELTSDMRQVRNQLNDVQNRLAGSVPGTKISNVSCQRACEGSTRASIEDIQYSTVHCQEKRLIRKLESN